MGLTYNSTQVNNLTINSANQPGSLYVLNGALNAFDANGVQTITNGLPIPVGTIFITALPVPPIGYVFCDGKEYSNADLPNLYNAIGTVFGSTTSTSFKVPNITTGSPVTAGCYYIIKT